MSMKLLANEPQEIHLRLCTCWWKRSRRLGSGSLSAGQSMDRWAMTSDAINNIFIDQRNHRAFTRLYERVIGNSNQVQQLIYDSKKLVMRRALASEVNVLAHRLNEISNQDRR